ncbi:MAG: NifU family protein [Calditrichia bacterium]
MISWIKKGNDDKASEENSSSQRISVTDTAREKINELIQNAETPVLGVRVLAEATTPVNPQYSLAFVQEGEVFDDDTVMDVNDFNIYIDGDSLPHVNGVELDFITTQMGGGGFRIQKPTLIPNLKGEVAEKLQKVIADQINPALGMHGGHITLIDVKDNKAYIELGGGCKGCGMVDVTLKNGIETLITQNVPEITEVLDTTDHASGDNPYYQPSK